MKKQVLKQMVEDWKAATAEATRDRDFYLQSANTKTIEIQELKEKLNKLQDEINTVNEKALGLQVMLEKFTEDNKVLRRAVEAYHSHHKKYSEIYLVGEQALISVGAILQDE